MIRNNFCEGNVLIRALKNGVLVLITWLSSFSAGLETELVFQTYWTIALLDFPEIWIYHGKETDKQFS